MPILIVVANAQMRAFETCCGDGFRMTSTWLPVSQTWRTARGIWKATLPGAGRAGLGRRPAPGFSRARQRAPGRTFRGQAWGVSGDATASESGEGKPCLAEEFSFLFEGFPCPCSLPSLRRYGCAASKAVHRGAVGGLGLPLEKPEEPLRLPRA